MACKVIILLLMAEIMTETSVADTPDEFCSWEIFQPFCLKDEVILMKSATYGRMRIGRCITTEEVNSLGSRHFGCSVDVLSQLDRICSGKSECVIHVVSTFVKNVQPCSPGLSSHLEASYDCITVAGEGASCTVDISSTPTHIVDSNKCGTKSQPWIVEAPVGQKISISIIAFSQSEEGQREKTTKQTCHDFGVVVDNVGKRNVTVCPVESLRETNLYLSAGNVVNIILSSSNSSAEGRPFIMKLRAVGCFDIIPPDDAYLKRSGDTVVVGCYTSRKSWHLSCEDGKWIGVIGNCSQGASTLDSGPETELKPSSLSNEQVLVVLALGGFTLALCLAIVCFGAVCWRRYYSKSKMKREYKTLTYQINSTGTQPIDRGIYPNATNDMSGFGAQQMPNYSVFDGNSEVSNDLKSVSLYNEAISL